MIDPLYWFYNLIIPEDYNCNLTFDVSKGIVIISAHDPAKEADAPMSQIGSFEIGET